MVKQFNFNKSYAEIFCSLPHKESGVYIQRICGYMFRDTEIEALSTDKIGCLLSLATEDLAE